MIYQHLAEGHEGRLRFLGGGRDRGQQGDGVAGHFTSCLCGLGMAGVFWLAARWLSLSCLCCFALFTSCLFLRSYYTLPWILYHALPVVVSFAFSSCPVLPQYFIQLYSTQLLSGGALPVHHHVCFRVDVFHYHPSGLVDVRPSVPPHHHAFPYISSHAAHLPALLYTCALPGLYPSPVPHYTLQHSLLPSCM